MSGGAVRGGTGIADVDPSIERAVAFGGSGLALSSAFATLEGGHIASGAAHSGGAWLENETGTAEAVRVWSGSLLHLRDATIAAGEAHSENHFWLEGNALANGGPGIGVSAGATALLDGGIVLGGNANAQAGSVTGSALAQPGCALKVEDGSRITIRNGTYSAGTGATSAAAGQLAEIAPTAAIEYAVTGSALPSRLTVFGGTFRGDHALRIAASEASSGDARVDILGGDLDSAGSVDLDLAHPFVTTNLYGFDIALDGTPISSGPVTATSGTLTGTLQLGGAFAWTFERRNGAPLEVSVPEPASGLAAGLIGLAALARGRGRPMRPFGLRRTPV